MRLFLQNIWIEYELTTRFSGSFKNAVYKYGNSEEVYTSRERIFIDSISEIIIFNNFYKFLGGNKVVCRIVAVNFNFETNPLFDGIKFMKIFYKAFGDFNIFLFVNNQEVYLGYNVLGKGNDDSFISFPLKTHMNWEEFSNVMYNTDNRDFIVFYKELSSAIRSINQFYGDVVYGNSEYAHYNYTKILKDYIAFGDEISSYKKKLSYIKSLRVNVLEDLYEAEMYQNSIEEVESIETTNETNNNGPADDELEEMASLMMTDPDEYMRRRRKKRSFLGVGKTY